MRSIAVSLLALATSAAFAADKDVEDILRVLRQNYSNAKSAQLEVQSYMRELGDQYLLTTRMQYVKPGKFRLVTKGESMGPNPLLMVSDGKTSYTKDPTGKVTREKFDPDKVASPINLESLCFWDWKRQLSTAKGDNMNASELRLLKKETWKDKDYMVLEEKAPKSNVFVRYYIDPVKKFIVRTAVYSLEDASILLQDHKVTKFELNPKIDPTAVKLPASTK